MGLTDDVLGSFNLMTPSSVVAAMALVKQGRIYDLAHVLDQDMPVPGFHGSFFANTQYTLENGKSGMIEFSECPRTASPHRIFGCRSATTRARISTS